MTGRKDGFQGEWQVVLPPMIVEMEKNDRLASSLYVTDIGYYPCASHHYRDRKVPIGQYILIYCVNGNGWYRVNGCEHQVGKGQFFILPPDVPHAYGASKGDSWTIYWVHFSGEYAEVYAEGMQTPQNINVTTNSRIMDRINIFEEILLTLQSGDSLEDLRYASSLLHHFLASMRYLGQFRKSQRPEEQHCHTSQTATDADIICDRTIHFLKENIENRISLQNIIDYTGYSQSHLSALFKKHTGMSPLAYFNRLKIERACQLLKDTDLKVNQICLKLGIDDQYYFSRLFSKAMGISPTAYRETVHDN